MKDTKKISSLSVIFPAYNDGGTIASMIATAKIAAEQVTDDFEIIVVNDSSSDYTAEVLEEMQKRYSELRVIQHETNRGYGGALISGFSSAKKDWIFYTDGDAQYNPLELTKLVDSLSIGVDAVNGYKAGRSDSLMRIFIGRLYHHFVKLLFGIRIRDVDCDFRLIPTKIMQEIQLKSFSGSICLEMVKKIESSGYVFAEVPVNHYARKYGVSQFFNFKRILQTLNQLAHLYWTLIIKKEHLNKSHEH
ncbi:MAG: glycosyltransferase family 2 protein [Anaerolineales bacterium]|nr:glycosyltransferase family 2 protein [Anaerolineales bacterium]MBX3036531.1 glycosyltransferase family 2 protein [Anaerolineales bacterium]